MTESEYESLLSDIGEQLNEALAPIHKRLDVIDSRLDRVETRLDRLETRMDRLETSVEAMRRTMTDDFRPAIDQLTEESVQRRFGQPAA